MGVASRDSTGFAVLPADILITVRFENTVAPDPAESRGAPPPPQDPSPLRGTPGSSLRSPAEGEGPGLLKPDSCPAGPGHTSTCCTPVQEGREVLPAPQDQAAISHQDARHRAQSRGLRWAGSEGGLPQQLPSGVIQGSPAPKPPTLPGAQSAPGRPHMPRTWAGLGLPEGLIRTHPQRPLTVGLLEERRAGATEEGVWGPRARPPL